MQISIELSAEQWNLILKGLGELPFKESSVLIKTIIDEANKPKVPVVESISEKDFENLPKELVENIGD